MWEMVVAITGIIMIGGVGVGAVEVDLKFDNGQRWKFLGGLLPVFGGSISAALLAAYDADGCAIAAAAEKATTAVTTAAAAIALSVRAPINPISPISPSSRPGR